MSRSPTDARRRWLGAALVLAGLGLLAFAGFELWQRHAAQRAAARALRTAPLPPVEGEAETIVRPREDAPAAAPSAARPAPGSVIGRIRIESAGVDVVALEGIGDKILDRAAGHFPGTALPGAKGNASFAAHRDSFFRGLREVGVGDRIDVETPDGTFAYRVSETRVVEPKAVEVIASRGRDELTLVTCFPFDYVGPAPRRFVVHADLIAPTG